MHGTIMVFLGVVRLAFGAFGNYIVPLQIGSDADRSVSAACKDLGRIDDHRDRSCSRPPRRRHEGRRHAHA